MHRACYSAWNIGAAKRVNVPLLSLSLFSLFVCELLPLSVCAVLSSIGCAPSAQSNCVTIGERVPLLSTNDLAQVPLKNTLQRAAARRCAVSKDWTDSKGLCENEAQTSAPTTLAIGTRIA